MSRAVERQLARIEQALGLSDGANGVALDDKHAGEEWVPPEQALRSQLPLLRLYATWEPKPDWFDERRAEVERMSPSVGYWRRRESEEELRHWHRLCDEQLAKLRSSSPILQALDADPALRARLDAEGRARLRRYLAPDDPLQALISALYPEGCA